MHKRWAALRLLDDEGGGEFTVSAHQLESARDPHGSFHGLVERAGEPAVEPAKERHVGRPYHVWRDNLELARALNDRLASNASD